MHRAPRADHLVAEVARLLSEPADDVFVPEWIAVHSRGVERWIAQSLSHHLGAGPNGDGVAAGIDFPFPRTVVARVVAAALDPAGRGTDDDPWEAGRLAFTLLDLLDRDMVDVAALGAFGAHLAGSRFRRLPALRHAAELLDRYQQHRPDMVAAWLDWDGTGPLPDGRGGVLPGHLSWQATLLRAARDRLGETRVERMHRAVSALRRDDGPLPGVPGRVLLFSLTALAQSHLEVLDALARRVDVHAFVLHPSPAAWHAAADHLPTTPDGGRPTRADASLPSVANPLLARWGRDSRELQVLLAARGRDRPVEVDEPVPTTLLERIQADVRADRAPGPMSDAGDPWLLAEDDRSVQVHAAHGQHRQVEVARDAILGLLADDPSLQPRDIVVMTPDVEAHAPLVDAAFRAARGPDSGLPDLRVRLADRALRAANPLLSAMADLLDLADTRLEAGPVLELLRREPVRRRFDLSEDDVEQVDGWLDEAGVRWGLDHLHRARFRMPTDVNTWRFGLDRLLGGVAVESDVVADRVLVSDAAHDRAELLGRVAEFVERLRHVVGRMLGAPAPPDGLARDGGSVETADHGHRVATWVEILREAADLLTAVDDDAGQRWEFDRVLEDLAANGGNGTAVVTLRELRGQLAGELAGRPTRANHQTGDLTVCTLVPMRSVPFRVVVVLGLDDGAFPRHRVPSGDDVLGLAPLVGDRDPRTEDRQLLLDALLSARDAFVVTYRGASERTNQEVPPSVVVAELLDVVADTACAPDGGDVLERVLTRHTLRAADPRNFDVARPGARGWDRVALAGARAAAGPARRAPVLCHRPPSEVAEPPDVLTIRRLAGILRAPTRSWVQHVFGFRDRDVDDPRDDNLAVEARGLAGWSLGEALLRGLLVGEDPARRLAMLRRAGALPVGRLADNAVDDHLPVAATIATAARSLARVHVGASPGSDEVTGPDGGRQGDRGPGEPGRDEIEVDLDLGEAMLRGTVSRPRSGVDVRVTYSSAKAGQLLDGWIDHLVSSAVGRPTHFVHVAKHPRTADSKTAVSHLFEPVEPDRARERLADLVAVARRVLVHPVPLFANTSGAYWAARRLDGKDEAAALSAAGRAWSSGFRTKWGEGHDPNVLRVFGNGPLATLVDAGATALADAPSWWDDEPHELARWARRVYDPLYGLVWIDHHPRVDVASVRVPA